MKLRVNTEDNRLICLKPEDEYERRVLETMWRTGIKAFAFGSSSTAELGICSKALFGSGFIEKGEENEMC